MSEKKCTELYFQVGNDNGNSEHDIMINGFQIAQPNVLAKVRKLPSLEELNPSFMIKDIESNLIITLDSPSADPGNYYIGDYALRSGERVRNIDFVVDSNKLDSDIIIINTLGQLAGHAAKLAYESDKEFKNTIIVNIDMTTALPIKQYSKDAAERFAGKFTKGTHKVTVHAGDLRANVELNFSFVKVIPEGVTAIHALQNITDNEIFGEYQKSLTENTVVNKEYFKNKKILHIAIGEGTTEFPITDDIKFDPNFIRGSDNGIGHCIDKAMDEFKNTFGLREYSRQKYSEVLKNSGHKYYPVAFDIVQGYIEDEAEDILHIAKQEIQKANNEIDIIVVYGGGSIPMKEKLYSKLNDFCTKANIKLFYVPEKYAVILESLGMYYFTIGPIFKALKNKASKVQE